MCFSKTVERSTEQNRAAITEVMKDGASHSCNMCAQSYALIACILACILCEHGWADDLGIRILNLKKLTNSFLSDTVSVSFEAHNDVGTLRYAMLQVDGHICPGGGGMLSTSVFSRPLKSRSRFEMDIPTRTE
jgi:hypothetical protein